MRVPRIRLHRFAAGCALLSVLAVALGVRLPGYDGRPLWIDELWRINLMMEPGIVRHYVSFPDVYTAITSPLYALLNRAIAVFGRSPEVLRLGSLLPGLAAVATAFVIVLRAGGGLATATAAGLLFALNADFVRYSNELKPYAFEVLVHLVCILFVVEVLSSRAVSRGLWTLFFAVLAAALLSGANAVILMPAIGATVLVHLLVSRNAGLREAIGGFSLLAGVALLMYFFVWSYGSDKDLLRYWSSGFNSGGPRAYPAFLAARLMETWKGAFALIGEPAARFRLYHTAFVVLVVSAVFHVTRRRQFIDGPASRVVLLYFLFFATLIGLNAMTLWPLGRLRPNLFVYAHVALLLLVLLARVPNRLAKNVLGAVLVAQLLVGLALVRRVELESASPPLERHDLVWRAFAPDADAGRRVAEQCRISKSVVFLNPAMAHALTYYKQAAEADGGKRSMLDDECVDLHLMPDAYADPQAARAVVLKFQNGTTPFWVIYSHIDRTDREYEVLVDLLADFGESRIREAFPGAGYFEVAPARARPVNPPSPPPASRPTRSGRSASS